ncbi:17090_t:CDS:1, partial [Dentiscutata heterogama]
LCEAAIAAPKPPKVVLYKILRGIKTLAVPVNKREKHPRASQSNH